jgi:hypothetical protein
VTTLHDQLVDDWAARTFWRRASLRSATSAIVLLQEQIPKAKRCYAWSFDDGKQTRSVTVLELPPVDSPETAVKVAIAAKARELGTVTGDRKRKT